MYLLTILIFTLPILGAVDLPPNIPVKSNVIYKTERYNKKTTELDERSFSLFLDKDKMGYAEKRLDGTYFRRFDIVDELKIEFNDFKSLKNISDYRKIYGDIKNSTVLMAPGGTLHSTMVIRKACIIDKRLVAIDIFLHVSREKGQEDANVDDVIVKIIKENEQRPNQSLNGSRPLMLSPALSQPDWPAP